jgi:repressor LexA
MKITKKQQEVLSAIQELVSKTGTSPTLRDVKDFLGYKNTSSVQRHTESLKKNEYLEDSRNLKIKKVLNRLSNIPVVGSVSCGTPLLAEQNIEAFIPYKVTGNPGDYFFLRAMGDSMNKSGIDDGDLVLIQKQETASNGDKVVALIGDEATIKIYKEDRDKIILNPNSHNSIHKPIYLFENIQIQGKVMDVIKIN